MVENRPAKGSLIGSKIAGYRVIEPLGRGAVGAVYLAKDLNLDRLVALKILTGGLSQDPLTVRGFHHEAQVAAPLKHPHIVHIYSAGIDRDIHYIAMEYVDGEPLDRFLRRTGRVKWESALCVAGQVAEALHCAHGHGIVHRDVKPGNLMLDRKGRVRLVDFGTAMATTSNGETVEGSDFVGTPQYLAPEQCTDGEIGPATDLFALGVTLYQMIAGSPPFAAKTSIELVRNICIQEPLRLNKAIPGVPDDVARLVARLLEKRPEDRPENGHEVVRRIRRLQTDRGGLSAWPAALATFAREQARVSPTRTAQVSRPKRRSRKRAPVAKRVREKARIGFRAAAMAAVALLCAVCAFLATGYRSPQPIQAATVDGFEFERAGKATLLASLPATGYRFTDLAWVGDRSAVLVEVAGRSGAITQGAKGLMVVEPGAERCQSLQAPTTPVWDPSHDDIQVNNAPIRTVPVTPADSPLHESVLRYAYQGSGSDRRIAVLAQGWDSGRPSEKILFHTALLDNASAIRAVPKPDGHTLCLVLPGESKGLVEHDVRPNSQERVGVPLTSSGNGILPETVQYSSDGRYLCYVRDVGGQRELWMIDSDGGGPDSAMLAAGCLGPHTAFSPDGRHVAVSMQDASGDIEVSLIDVVTKKAVAQLGPGHLGKEPWHPSGKYLIVTDAGQIWAVETFSPHLRVQLTDLPRGVAPGCAVSRCGRWAVGVAAGASNPTLVFVDLLSVSSRQEDKAARALLRS